MSYSSVFPLNQGRWLTSFLSLYTPSASNPSPPSRLSSVVPLETHTKPFNPRMISTPVGPQGGEIWWKWDFRRRMRRGGRVRRCPLRSWPSAWNKSSNDYRTLPYFNDRVCRDIAPSPINAWTSATSSCTSVGRQVFKKADVHHPLPKILASSRRPTRSFSSI